MLLQLWDAYQNKVGDLLSKSIIAFTFPWTVIATIALALVVSFSDSQVTHLTVRTEVIVQLEGLEKRGVSPAFIPAFTIMQFLVGWLLLVFTHRRWTWGVSGI